MADLTPNKFPLSAFQFLLAVDGHVGLDRDAMGRPHCRPLQSCFLLILCTMYVHAPLYHVIELRFHLTSVGKFEEKGENCPLFPPRGRSQAWLLVIASRRISSVWK